MEPNIPKPEANCFDDPSQSPERKLELPEWSVDPANAKNWKLSKKIYNNAIPALLCLLMSVLPLTFSFAWNHRAKVSILQKFVWIGYLFAVPW